MAIVVSGWTDDQLQRKAVGKYQTSVWIRNWRYISITENPGSHAIQVCFFFWYAGDLQAKFTIKPTSFYYVN